MKIGKPRVLAVELIYKARQYLGKGVVKMTSAIRMNGFSGGLAWCLAISCATLALQSTLIASERTIQAVCVKSKGDFTKPLTELNSFYDYRLVRRKGALFIVHAGKWVEVVSAEGAKFDDSFYFQSSPYRMGRVFSDGMFIIISALSNNEFKAETFGPNGRSVEARRETVGDRDFNLSRMIPGIIKCIKEN